MPGTQLAILVVSMFAFGLFRPSSGLLTLPQTTQTTGMPWPLPQNMNTEQTTQSLSDKTFKFHITNSASECTVVQAAAERYFQLIFYTGAYRSSPWQTVQGPMLQSLDITLNGPCEELPHFGMDESYKLSVDTTAASLTARAVWGILRGMETFSQLIWENDSGQLTINNTNIVDYPRFSWRGVLLDTSRHFIPIDGLRQYLDAMAYNKMNVFHWHVVDSPSFPYQSRMFPDLSQKGAYDPYTHVYSQEDVQEIVRYASLRGIRVVPEFDTPGHSASWGKGQKLLLTKCYDKAGQFHGKYGPVDPSRNSTFAFMKEFLREVTEVFPEQYIHLGGDEVYYGCWKSNPSVQAFMTKMGFGSDYAKLEEYYMQKVLNYVIQHNGQPVVWEDVVNNAVKVNPNTVVQVWRGGFRQRLKNLTAAGHQSILSSCWYLNRIRFGKDWPGLYKCDPWDFNGTAKQKEYVIGGEMCMWGEFIDATNVMSRSWPRGSVVAERLWSSQEVKNPTTATPRLEEHRCRMVQRGLNAEPVNGPGYCKYEYDPSVWANLRT